MTDQNGDGVAAEFVQAMRRLAASVTLITVGTAPDWSGMAATAVVSVSVDPATLLVVVNRSASIHPILRREGRFRVNILSHAHDELVATFSGKAKGAERFRSGHWEGDPHGLPMLVDATASIGCQVETALGWGTHTAFFGLVTDARCHGDAPPLLWADGGLRALAEHAS